MDKIQSSPCTGIVALPYLPAGKPSRQALASPRFQISTVSAGHYKSGQGSPEATEELTLFVLRSMLHDEEDILPSKLGRMSSFFALWRSNF
jgi:hypothetical protein